MTSETTPAMPPTPVTPPARINVARLMVKLLRANGVDRVYCVPGESYLPVLDALHEERLDIVTCHHESAAGFMALAEGRLTGRPGICLVSRGPGATNAAIAIHAAEQDAAPLILLIGQVERRNLRRGAFQEIDYQRFFGSIAKYVAEVSDPALLVEVMTRAFQAALSGTPGPAVVALPQDMLYEAVPEIAPRPQARPATAPDAAALAESLALLRAARRPLIIAGGALADAAGQRALLAAAEAWSIPVAVSFRRMELFPNDHPLYAGDLGVANSAAQLAALGESDLILAVGTRLGDLTTKGYTFPELPWPRQRLIHVFDDAAVIGRHFQPDIGIACPAAAFLERLAEAPANGADPERRRWIERLHGLRLELAHWPPRRAPDGVVFGNVVQAIARRLGPQAFVVLDAGLSAAMFYRYVLFRPPQRLFPSIAGCMGFGVPAAIVAALRHPGRRILCVCGDGGILMTGNELALIVERRLPITLIVANNRSLGSIRFQQEREYPGHTAGTDLATPDFARWAEAFGCPGRVLESEAAIEDEIERALGAQGPFLLEVKASLSALLPSAILGPAGG